MKVVGITQPVPNMSLAEKISDKKDFIKDACDAFGAQSFGIPANADPKTWITKQTDEMIDSLVKRVNTRWACVQEAAKRGEAAANWYTGRETAKRWIAGVAALTMAAFGVTRQVTAISSVGHSILGYCEITIPVVLGVAAAWLSSFQETSLDIIQSCKEDPVVSQHVTFHYAGDEVNAQ